MEGPLDDARVREQLSSPRWYACARTPPHCVQILIGKMTTVASTAAASECSFTSWVSALFSGFAPTSLTATAAATSFLAALLVVRWLRRIRAAQEEQQQLNTLLHDKLIWVTGASSGLGRSLALSAARRGARLILTARSRERLKTVADECVAFGCSGGVPLCVSVDLAALALKPDALVALASGDGDSVRAALMLSGSSSSSSSTEVSGGVGSGTCVPPLSLPLPLPDEGRKESQSQEQGGWTEEDIDELVQSASAIKKLGQINVLVNNAGVSSRSRAEDTDISVDTRLMRLNFLAPVALTKGVLCTMLRNNRDSNSISSSSSFSSSSSSGTLVYVSSVQGLLSLPFRSSYAASKFALQGWCDALRAEVSSRGVRVCVASPGYIRTNLSRNAVTGDGSAAGVMDATTAAGQDPDVLAEDIWRAAAAGRARHDPYPLSAYVAVVARSLVPRLVDWVMARRYQRQARQLAD